MTEVPQTLREELFARGEDLWNEHRARLGGRFSSFIPADYDLAYEALREVRDRGQHFVELGSGAGVVTILADLLGFDASGIEIDDWLVGQSTALADDFQSEAQFVAGSFVPAAMRDEVEHLQADFLAEIEGANAYAELGMDLRDFDVIYDYHWPEQADLHNDMLVRFARPGTVILRFSASEGFEISTL